MNNIKLFDYKPKLTDFKIEVIKGLTSTPKILPPKLFYDEEGSKLFEQIVKLKEYYIPLIERKILIDNQFSINNLIGENVTLIEPGSGSCEKVQEIFSTNNNIKAYVPIEISADFLYESIKKISNKFPQIMFYPIAIDYLNNFELPEEIINYSKNKVIFFPGSSIGNYDRDDVIKILTSFSKIAGKNSGLLIGVDMKKDKKILELAYDDPKKITSSFNLNLIKRIKNELNIDISINDFYHEAIYNEDMGRIEMYLVSNKNQDFFIDDNIISLKNGEKIHTENSYKYSIDDFINLVENVGYKISEYWTDSKNYFSIFYFKI